MRKEEAMAALHNLDRRHLLGFLGAGMAVMAAPKALAAGEDPCNPTSLPSHLSFLVPQYPDALIPHAHRLAVTATHGKKDRLLKPIDDLVKKNKAFFQKADFVKNLSQVVKMGKAPKSVLEMLSLFDAGWTPPSAKLCEPVAGKCKDFGCSNNCKQGGKYTGGECVGLFTDEPCSCVCNPGAPEFSLMGLIVLALFATPAPDQIPGTLANITQTILRAAAVKP
jgi:hypothetical protein